MLVLLPFPPFLSTSPIPLLQLPPSSEWSSVDYTLYLPLLSRSLAQVLAATHKLAKFRHTYISNIHA